MPATFSGVHAVACRGVAPLAGRRTAASAVVFSRFSAPALCAMKKATAWVAFLFDVEDQQPGGAICGVESCPIGLAEAEFTQPLGGAGSPVAAAQTYMGATEHDCPT